MVHTRKPVFKTSALQILSLDESNLLDDEKATTTTTTTTSSASNGVKVPTSTGSAAAAPKSTTSMPGSATSFQGFEIKTDPKIRRQAKKSWFDLNDDNSSTATTPFVSASPFEGISGSVGAFPPPSAEDLPPAVAAAHQDDHAGQEGPSPSTPVKENPTPAEDAAAVSSPPLKPGQEDADGAEGFEQETSSAQQQERTFNVPPPSFHQYAAAHPQQHQYNPYQQHPQHFAARSFQSQNAGAFRSHHHQEQSRNMMTHAPAPLVNVSGALAGAALSRQATSRSSQGSSSRSSPAPEGDAPSPSGTAAVGATSGVVPHNLTQKPANHELVGFLPFYKFDDLALTGDLPSAEMLGAAPQHHAKLFLGHVWSRVPTGVIQWMLNSFGPRQSTAFNPQLHYNREGWFRGCLHVSVVTEDPQALIYALHKRVLFDHEGVWFAETADQMRFLDDYCRRLRALPQHVRHTKLQSLPCNPLACELARNE